jgi:SAM-dependent methyltransferase
VRLNALGRASMNNPARAFLQRRYVSGIFERLGGRVPDGNVLEVGCGRGALLETLRRRFGAGRVVGLDLDPRMLTTARPRPGNVLAADVTAIPLPAESLDAVFDFGAVHFVADWERALDEVRRVLRPGGRYYFEWVTGRLLRSLYPLAAERFSRMDAPDAHALLVALERRGLRTAGAVARPRAVAAATYLVGDVIGVATAA